MDEDEREKSNSDTYWFTDSERILIINTIWIIWCPLVVLFIIAKKYDKLQAYWSAVWCAITCGCGWMIEFIIWSKDNLAFLAAVIIIDGAMEIYSFMITFAEEWAFNLKRTGDLKKDDNVLLLQYLHLIFCSIVYSFI